MRKDRAWYATKMSLYVLGGVAAVLAGLSVTIWLAVTTPIGFAITLVGGLLTAMWMSFYNMP